MKTRALIMAAMLAAGPAAGADSADGQSFVVDKVYQGGDVIWGFDFISVNSPDEIVFR